MHGEESHQSCSLERDSKTNNHESAHEALAHTSATADSYQKMWQEHRRQLQEDKTIPRVGTEHISKKRKNENRLEIGKVLHWNDERSAKKMGKDPISPAIQLVINMLTK